MADGPKAGAPGTGDGTATVAPQAEKPSPEVRDAGVPGETAEQKATRLEEELKNARAQQASMQDKVVEAKRIIERQAASPPPTTAAAPPDSLDQRIAALEQQARDYPADPTIAEALDGAYGKRDYRDQHKRIAAARPAKFRRRAAELFVNGYATTPEAALAAARGEVDHETELEKLRRDNEDLRRDKEAREAGVVSTGARPVITPAPKKVRADGTRVFTRKQWAETRNLPAAEQRELQQLYKAGLVDFED